MILTLILTSYRSKTQLFWWKRASKFTFDSKLTKTVRGTMVLEISLSTSVIPNVVTSRTICSCFPVRVSPPSRDYSLSQNRCIPSFYTVVKNSSYSSGLSCSNATLVSRPVYCEISTRSLLLTWESLWVHSVPFRDVSLLDLHMVQLPMGLAPFRLSAIWIWSRLLLPLIFRTHSIHERK